MRITALSCVFGCKRAEDVGSYNQEKAEPGGSALLLETTQNGTSSSIVPLGGSTSTWGTSVGRAPRNCTLNATISVRYCFDPPSLGSHARVRKRPSTYTSRPLSRYFAQVSASFPKTTMLCQSTRSCFCPCLSRNTSLVATEKAVTAAPLVGM